MIEMAVREQDARQAFEPRAGLQDLSLRTFAAIDEEAIFVMRNDLRGKPAFCRRRGGRCTKKKNFEQCRILTTISHTVRAASRAGASRQSTRSKESENTMAKCLTV